MRILAILFVFLSFISMKTQAQDSASSSKLSTEKVKPKKSFQNDDEIKDMELKAEAGANTRWSMKASMGYSGPSLSEPFSDRRRNPDGRFTDVRTSLGGSVGLRYRNTKKSTINLGTGVSAVKPFHGIEQVDAQDPYLSFDYASEWAQIQWYSRASVSATTTEFFREVGQVGSTSLSQSGRYFIPDTQWTVGFNTSISFFHYDRPYSKTSPHGGSNYFVGFYPNLSYRLNSKWMLTTSSSFNAGSRRYFKDWAKWDTNEITQRVGVGWSITRVVYLSPYVNFYWKDPSWETSNFAFSTIFSVF